MGDPMLHVTPQRNRYPQIANDNRIFLCISLLRHFNVAIRLLSFALNGKKTPFDLLKYSRIVINHSTVETNFNGSVGNQQVFTFVAVKIFNSTFFIAVTTTEVTLNFLQLSPRPISGYCSNMFPFSTASST